MNITLPQNIDTLARIFRARVGKQKFPLSVTLLITYRCNFSCKYCDIWNLTTPEMTTAQIRAMIDELSGMGLRRFSFNGGEPLLREDIGELISYCKEKKLFTTVFTNGWLVPQKIDAIKKVGVLIVTLDGPENVHDAQRNFPGSFARAIEAIKAARKNDVVTWTNTVITNNNISSLDFILEKADELGSSAIFQPVLEYSHSAGNAHINSLKANPNGYDQAIRRLIKRKKEGARIIHSYTYLKHLLNIDWNTNKRQCWAGKLYCAIKPNGEVAPCYPVFNETTWPNGLEIGFRKAFLESRITGCKGCYCIIAETDFFYSCRPEAVMNMLRTLPI